MSSVRSVYALIAVTIFFGSVHYYLSDHYSIGVPWHWVVAFIVLSLPVIFVQVMNSDILRQPITIWCAGYAWVTIVWFIAGPQSEMSWQEVRSRILAIMEILAFLSVLMDPRAVLFAQRALAVAVHVGVAINIYELFVPMSFSNVFGRSAGLYVNPNLSAEALVLGLILSVTVIPAWYRGYFLLFTGLGVFVTFSRGGVIGWFIAIGGLALARFVSGRHLIGTAVFSLLLISFVFLPNAGEILTTLERVGSLNANVLTRVEWLTDPSGVSDASSWSRVRVLQQAWDRVGEHPFWGAGTGAVHEGLDIPPHNQFLTYMIDHGVFGAMLLPLLLLAVMWRCEGDNKTIGLIFCCAILWFSFFTHTMMMNSYSLLLFSLVAAFASMRVEQNNRENQHGLNKSLDPDILSRPLVQPRTSL